MTNPGNQGWRSGAGPKDDRSKKKRDWRSDTVRSGSAVRWKRLLKFGTGFGLIAGLVVVIILLFGMGKETNVNVAALGPQQYNSLPIPLARWNTATLVSEWTGETADQVFTPTDATTKSFDIPSLTRDRSIIYVRAMAIGTPDGVRLCDEAVTPATLGSSGKLLKDLATDLMDLNGRKLVLLDISPMRSDWRMGYLSADFMTELRDLESKAVSSGTIFLTASDVGERSWRSRRFGGQSVFRHFVQLGLRGKAAEDRYVSVKRLIEYVTKETSSWAVKQRETQPGQHPQCVPGLDKLGSDSPLNFTLANVAVNQDVSPTAQRDSKEDCDRLKQLWGWQSQLSQAKRWSPVAWRKLTDELMLQEQRVALGFEPNTEKAVAALSVFGDTTGEDWKPKAGFPLAYLNANTWFGAAVSPRLLSDERPESPGDTTLAEDVLDANFKWFTEQRRQANQPELTLKETVPAIALQTTAETAHARSIAILPFVQAELEHADTLRRKAHDLLFTAAARQPVSETNGTLDATIALQRATQANNQALNAVTAMRASHNALLDTLAELPYLARFAAASMPPANEAKQFLTATQAQANNRTFFLHPTGSRTSEVIDKDLKSVQQIGGRSESAEIASLFAATRELAVRFDQFDRAKAGEELRQRLQSQDATDNVETQVQKINRLGSLLADRLSGLKSGLLSDAAKLSEQKEQANAEDRQNIVRYLHLPFLPADVRDSLFKRRIAFEGAAPDTAAVSPSPPEKDAWLLRGQWQTFWALQMRSLNPRSAEWFLGDEVPLAAWRSIATSDTQSAVYGNLTKIGQFLRSDLAQQKAALASSTKRPAGRVSIEERSLQLRRADYLARIMPWSEAEDGDPRSAMQQIAIAEFALHSADRIKRDFLRRASDNGHDNDWFRKGIEAAKSLAEQNDADRLTEYQALTSHDFDNALVLQQQDQLSFKRTDTSRMLKLGIDESNLPAGVTGIAAAWALPDAGPSIQTQLNGVPIQLASGTDAGLTLRKDESRDGDCKAGDLPVQLFFRGHTTSRKFKVNPCTQADFTVVRLPSAPTGAVKVEGRTQRAIIFVLDWSLSMRKPAGSNGERRRYEVAMAALQNAIKDLRDDDEVGLVIFGHRAKLALDEVSTEYNEQGDALTQYGGGRPNSWRTDTQVIVRRGAKRTIGTALDGWLKRLKSDAALLPFGNTPLYAAVNLAALQLPEGGAIIVISDGDSDDNPQAGLEDKLKRRNVTASAIQFDFTAKEKLASFMDGIPANAGNLAAKISSAIPPREYRLARAGATTQPLRTLLGVTSQNLRVGKYDLKFGENQISALPVTGGELHLFKLQQGRFVRVLGNLTQPIDARISERSPVAPNPTRLGHTAFVTSNTSATITVTLDHTDTTRPVTWPAEIEFQVIPEGSPPITHLRVTPVPNQPVPTYQLLADKCWPPDTGQVRINAWWKPKRTREEVTVKWSDLKGAAKDEQRNGIVRLDSVGARPALKVEARETSTGINLSVTVDGQNAAFIEGLRVEPGYVTSADGFSPIAAEQTSSRYWNKSGVAEFDFALPEITNQLRFAITSRSVLRSGSTTAKDQRPRNISSGTNSNVRGQ